MHERLRLDVAGFWVAPLRPQRIHQQPPRLRLRAMIATGERQGLAGATLRLTCVVFGEP